MLVLEIFTTAHSAEDIVIRSSLGHPARDILVGDVMHRDTIRWQAIGPTVEVVLLDIDTPGLDIGHKNVGVSDVNHAARRVIVCFDAQAVG